MPDYRTMYDREYIYAFDLDGHDVTVTIARVIGVELRGTDGKKAKKPALSFEGKDKGLALCKTNARTVAAMYGNDTTKWVGKRVTLYPTTCEAFGATVECIRIRPTIPQNHKGKGKADDTSRA